MPGASATATAAAWGNRLDEPITNVSKVYFGLSRVSPGRRTEGLVRWRRVVEATSRSVDISTGWTRRFIARGVSAGRPSPSAGFTVTASRISRPNAHGQGVLELAAQPALELGAGEVVADRDDRGVAVQRDRLAGLDPGLLVGLQLLDHALPGSSQVGIVVHR